MLLHHLLKVWGQFLLKFLKDVTFSPQWYIYLIVKYTKTCDYFDRLIPIHNPCDMYVWSNRTR